MATKFAVRITNGTTTHLFAIVAIDNVTYYRWLARKTIEVGSFYWVTVGPWN